jgi:hypothetical protein
MIINFTGITIEWISLPAIVSEAGDPEAAS